MKIVVTGSLGHISKPLALDLIKAGHQVTVVSSKKEKTTEIQALAASAAIGSVEDVAFLTRTFTGADAVYTMVPPNFAADNWRSYISGIGANYTKAIKAAGVKKVVNLSSIGAHLPEGTGPIKGLFDVEQALNAFDGVAVRHLRAGFFYTNFYSNVDMIKHMGILGSNYGAGNHLPLVSPADIADAAAEELQQSFTGKGIRYVTSDEKTAGEVASILGAAIGKPDLKWVEFSDADALGGMKQAGLPDEIAKNYTEMGVAIRENKLWDDYIKHKPAVLGKRKFAEFAKEFAAVYNK
ncbi:MAG TPA: NAD(P)H-binding protein [Puia sp.]|nr:NAD(P)H-binding protein [Puia sp.]